LALTDEDADQSCDGLETQSRECGGQSGSKPFPPQFYEHPNVGNSNSWMRNATLET